MWRLEGNLKVAVLSFHLYLGCRGQTQVLRLGNKHLYLMSHLAGLRKRKFSSTSLRTYDIEYARYQERKLADVLPARDPENRPGWDGVKQRHVLGYQDLKNQESRLLFIPVVSYLMCQECIEMDYRWMRTIQRSQKGRNRLIALAQWWWDDSTICADVDADGAEKDAGHLVAMEICAVYRHHHRCALGSLLPMTSTKGWKTDPFWESHHLVPPKWSKEWQLFICCVPPGLG